MHVGVFAYTSRQDQRDAALHLAQKVGRFVMDLASWGIHSRVSDWPLRKSCLPHRRAKGVNSTRSM